MTCPDDFTRTIPIGSSSVFVNWNIPSVTDNSGQTPTLGDPNRSPGQFQAGTYFVAYQATDGSGNTADCTFTITVIQEGKFFTDSPPVGFSFTISNPLLSYEAIHVLPCLFQSFQSQSGGTFLLGRIYLIHIWIFCHDLWIPSFFFLFGSEKLMYRHDSNCNHTCSCFQLGWTAQVFAGGCVYSIVKKDIWNITSL